MAATAAPAPLDPGLSRVVTDPLALDAFDVWAAGTLGRHSLAENRTTDAHRHVNTLQGLAITCHPRVRRLAQARCDQIADALTARARSLSDEVA